MEIEDNLLFPPSKLFLPPFFEINFKKIWRGSSDLPWMTAMSAGHWRNKKGQSSPQNLSK
jgi:hypothetical protein